MTINQLIEMSGDSILEAHSFKAGVLTVKFFPFDSNFSHITISIPTDYLICNISPNSNLDSAYFFLVMKRLTDHVSISKEGYFLPPIDFVQLMKDRKVGITLCYGRKSTEVNYLFFLQSVTPLITCLVKDPEEILIQTEKV